MEFVSKTLQDCDISLVKFNIENPVLENTGENAKMLKGILNLYENIFFIVKNLKLNLLISKISNFLGSESQLMPNEVNMLVSQILVEFNVSI